MGNVIVLSDCTGNEIYLMNTKYLMDNLEDLIKSKTDTLTSWLFNSSKSYKVGEVDIKPYRSKLRELTGLEEDMWENQDNMTDDEISKCLESFDSRYNMLIENLKSEIKGVL